MYTMAKFQMSYFDSDVSGGILEQQRVVLKVYYS